MQSQFQSKRDVALSLALNVSEAFCSGATGCGVVGVESAAGLLLAVLQQLKAVKENEETCKGLIDEISCLTSVLDSVLDNIGRPKTEDEQAKVARLGSEGEFKIRVDGLLTALRKVEQDAKGLVPITSGKGVKGFSKRLLLASPNKDLLDSLATAVNKATKEFQFRGSIAVEVISREILQKVEQETKTARLAREADDTRREVERQNQEWNELLGRLSRAGVNAEYSSITNVAGPPLKETRVALLKEIDEWAIRDSASDGHSPFYVLTGGAGMGKSTIAYGVAESAKERRDRGEAGQLGASFFFTRGAAGLDSADTVFPTLAHQLLTNLSALRPLATSVIEEYLRLGERPKLEIQAEHLFVRLLSKLPPNHPSIVIVIDAVDECTVLHHAKCMLSLIMEGLSHLTSSVHVFVTSRPEIHIEYALRSPPFVTPSNSIKFPTKLKRFWLHEIPQDVADGDIRLYLETELRTLRVDGVFSNDPIANVAQKLTELSSGLFIYATTLIHYLRLCAQEGNVPDLGQLLGGERRAPNLALERLGELYTLVLDQAPLEASEPEEALISIQAVLGYIAVLQDHVSSNTLIALSPPNRRKYVLPALRRLAPVLSFNPETPEVPVRPLHSSFVDFLLDPSRCDAKFFVLAQEQHLRLSAAALDLLTSSGTLGRTVRHFQHSDNAPPSIPDVDSKLVEFPLYAVQYACLYWPFHIFHSGNPPEGSAMDITSSVSEVVRHFEDVVPAFVQPEHLLRWIEVLAYLRNLDTAVEWLPRLSRMFSGREKQVADLLVDVYRLVVQFYPALIEDPPPIYNRKSV